MAATPAPASVLKIYQPVLRWEGHCALTHTAGILATFEASTEANYHDEVFRGRTHESSWSHELIAGAAAFEAMKSIENGTHDKHKVSKELFAALAAAEADKLFETKGLDFLDRETAKRQAEQNAERIYDAKYA
ncbi:hypothetical protein EDD11_009007 [Mortierella claussenii]|nr:hypothetical protein EDD11_009007 [Mortierella claussenii]